MADYRLVGAVRLVRRRFRVLRPQALEELKTVYAFRHRSAHRRARLLFAFDERAHPLAAEPAESLGRRAVDHVAGGPHARPSDRAVLYAIALSDDPIGRVIGDRRACRDAEVKVKLAHPVAQVAVTVDEPGQDRLAFSVDHFRAFRRLYVAALTDVADAAVLENDDGIGERRASRAVDQRAALDDHGAALRRYDSAAEQNDDRNERRARQCRFHVVLR